MKKNLLIMMMMVLCAGFVSAQTINTVRGFVPGGSTGAGDNATYVVIGQPFSMMSVANADAQAEVMVGLAQMQLITDTTMTVVGYKDGYHEHGLDLNAQELLEALDDLSTCSNGEVEGYMGFLNFQKPNLAHNNDNFEYYYDSLFVVKVFICPDSTKDAGDNKYEVIALNEKCWINSNLRTTVACGGGSVEGMIYNSELNEVTEDMLPTYGMLYTFAAATGAANNADGVQCDEETGYLQGICPCNWHLPTAEEMAPLFVLPAENLRVNGNWIVEGNNNLTGFSAEPAGFYNSTSQRFEGLLTETDYWMINCEKLNEPIQDVFQLIYSCNTPLKPQHSSEDALSVRCVYDIIYAFDNCEPNPEPQPVPPTTQCPTVQIQDAEAMVVPVIIDSYGEIADHISSVAFSGQVLINNSDNPVTVNDQITDINADGYFVWEYVTPVEVEITSITGNILITLDNNQVCSTSVRKVVDNDCPTLTLTPISFGAIEGTITPYNANDNYSIVISGHYVGVFQEDDKEDDFEEVMVDNIQQDGTFIWNFDGGQYDVDYVTSITGEFTITGLPQGCPQSFEFNTAPSCSLSVGQVNLNVNSDGVVATVLINNLSSDYLFDDNSISCGFMFYNENEEGNMYNPAYSSYDYDLFDTVTSNGVTTLTAALPAGVTMPSKDFVQFWVDFNINPEYYYCSEDPDFIIHREATQQINSTPDQPIGNNCPTSYQLDALDNNAAKLTIGGYDADVVQSVNITFHVFQSGNTSAQDYPYNSITIDEGSNPATFTAALSGVSLESVTKITASASVDFNPSNYNYGLCDPPTINTVTVYEDNCPSYGTPDPVNAQYFIPVSNYDYEEGDAFTVTCVYNVGNIDQTIIEEYSGEASYGDGNLVITLGNVPTYYCGLSFKIKLNNSCEKTVIATICE